jgi:hypothetical protein
MKYEFIRFMEVLEHLSENSVRYAVKALRFQKEFQKIAVVENFPAVCVLDKM